MTATYGKPRVEWKGERQHEQIATPEKVNPPPYYPDHPVVRAGMGPIPQFRFGDGQNHRCPPKVGADGLAETPL